MDRRYCPRFAALSIAGAILVFPDSNHPDRKALLMRTRPGWNHKIFREGADSRIARRRELLAMVGFSVLLAAAPAAANVKLPALISDNMVLQQGQPAAIWGTADPGEEVTVSLDGEKRETTAASNGRWKVELGPLKAGGPWEMTVAGINTLTIHNVLVGEVWVCSGQSNMEYAVEGRPGVLGGVMNAGEEVAAAHYPRLRLFKVQVAVAGKPQSDVQGHWEMASPGTVRDFSAAGYFFGRDLHQALRVPVGMIDSSKGGTPAEAWMSVATLEADPALKMVLDSWRQIIAEYPQVLDKYEQALSGWEKSAEQAEAGGKVAPQFPKPPQDPRSHRWRDAGLWNGMIAPLTPYRIAGVIWYQGESNADSPYQYRHVFTRLIRSWRRAWGEGDFPFLFVQLASFKVGGEDPDSWAVLRESQAKALALPKTGMAVAIDIGDAHSIHPRNKQEVGRRLALAAEAVAYGRKVDDQGPTFKSLRAEKGTLRLRFSHVDGGLAARGGALAGFQIAGEDQKFVPAEAQIQGSEVVLSSPLVPKPLAARYAWADYPQCNLYNRAGLPAPPFRTDRWTVTLQEHVRTAAPKLW